MIILEYLAEASNEEDGCSPWVKKVVDTQPDAPFEVRLAED